MTTSWHTYPSIFNLGHHFIEDLLLDNVLVEEKIDGSQFSFGRFYVGSGCSAAPLLAPTQLRCRSKGADIDTMHPEKMFASAVTWCLNEMHHFHVGWTYRCEFLSKPKHNTLKYDRVPANNLIVFDINDGEESYLNYIDKHNEAERIGLECVPCLWHGLVLNADHFKDWMSTTSILGGTKIEGIVVKNYHRVGADKHVLMGKHVSEAFKEEHSNAWRKSNPTGGDIIAQIGAKYSTGARWSKAVQHLRDAGQLEDSPKDIGFLIKEVPLDVFKECEAEIEQALIDWAWPKIRREITRGLPSWYKERLMERQFVVEETTPELNALTYGGPEYRVDSGDNVGLESEQPGIELEPLKRPYASEAVPDLEYPPQTETETIPNKESTTTPADTPRLGLNTDGRENKPVVHFSEKIKDGKQVKP